jgi:hypothetical protein
MPPTSERPPAARVLKPVIGPRLRGLLAVAFTLFGLLAVNSFYLASVTVLEELSGDLYQDFFYQIMFLLHLVLGLLIVVPGVVFGALHLRNAWPRPNYRAVRAGLALYVTVLLMLISGLALTRFDFFSLKDPGCTWRRLCWRSGSSYCTAWRARESVMDGESSGARRPFC